jgi:VanZ family protein
MIRSRWVWVVGWALLIEMLVLWPSPPEVPQPLWVIGFDKLVHAALFAVQAALAGWALAARDRPAWPAGVGVVVFAVATELEQQFIPSRSMELGDILADAAGAVIGLAVFAALAPRRRERHR